MPIAVDSDELGQVSCHGVYACEPCCVCVCLCVCACVGWWEVMEHETRKKNRLSSLVKGYSLYRILDHSSCSMKNALAEEKIEVGSKIRSPFVELI